MNWFKKGSKPQQPSAPQQPPEAAVNLDADLAQLSPNIDVAQFGPYRVLDRLGGGGMGIVYKVQGPDGQAYALKALNAGKTDDAENLERFKREIAIGLELKHPNVNRMHDCGVDHRGRPFIVMELLEGIPLSEYIRMRAPLPLEEARDIIVFILLGLAAIHDGGVVHRDLKPQNVFMCQNGSIQIMDFGIARKEGQKDITVTGTALGTSTFISPEQLVDTKHVDRRTDIFNVGLIFYQMVTKRLAFDGATFAAVVKKVLQCTYPPVTTLRPDLPAEAEEWVARLICKDLQTRYQSAPEALQGIRF